MLTQSPCDLLKIKISLFFKKKNKNKIKVKKQSCNSFFCRHFLTYIRDRGLTTRTRCKCGPFCPRGDVFRHSQSSFLPFEDREVLVSAERILITSLRALLIWAPNLWESCNVERWVLNMKRDPPATKKKKEAVCGLRVKNLTCKKEMEQEMNRRQVSQLTVKLTFLAEWAIWISCAHSHYLQSQWREWILPSLPIAHHRRKSAYFLLLSNRVSLFLRKGDDWHWMYSVCRFFFF